MFRSRDLPTAVNVRVSSSQESELVSLANLRVRGRLSGDSGRSSRGQRAAGRSFPVTRALRMAAGMAGLAAGYTGAAHAEDGGGAGEMRLDEGGEGAREAATPVVRSAMIVGGGIAGLAAALALRRVGVQVEVSGSEGGETRGRSRALERAAR